MNRKLLYYISLITTICLATLQAEPQSAQTNAVASSGSPEDKIVVKGKGVEIRRSELDKEMQHAASQAALDGRSVTAEQRPALERQVLEQLVNARLLMARATAADKAAGKTAAEKRYAAAEAKLGSEDLFNGRLKLLGITGPELLAKWTEALTAESVIKRELKINITDKEARKYYDENPKQFDAPDIVRISHILFSSRDPVTKGELTAEQKAAKHKKAEEVLKRARAGENFAALALEFSNDLGSRAKGGEYTFTHGQFVPEVEAVAFSMKPNEISDIVTSTEGYHIVKLIEKTPAGKIEFPKAAPDIRAGLTQQAIQQGFPDYIAGLRKEAGVELPIPPGYGSR
jgi:parvulin-like peptidyl-prolyl isomerase